VASDFVRTTLGFHFFHLFFALCSGLLLNGKAPPSRARALADVRRIACVFEYHFSSVSTALYWATVTLHHPLSFGL